MDTATDINANMLEVTRRKKAAYMRQPDAFTRLGQNATVPHPLMKVGAQDLEKRDVAEWGVE
ncbi:hypothetical protein E4U55_002379 [Claviceps digitariae]|nr:hypothetical protein E4U55_002379 [Claviceps digitariae]